VTAPAKYVPSEGPTNARIVLIGESPWTQEVATGRPFAGQSGKLLERWWFDIGLRRPELYIMNLYPYKPPTRDIESVSAKELVKWSVDLHQRIAALEGPVVLVPLGNYATFALTGKGKVKAAVRNEFSMMETGATEAEKKAGITKLLQRRCCRRRSGLGGVLGIGGGFGLSRGFLNFDNLIVAILSIRARGMLRIS
jgi:uracil-DNA glycosylase family 4